jgi:hypothetical protein
MLMKKISMLLLLTLGVRRVSWAGSSDDAKMWAPTSKMIEKPSVPDIKFSSSISHLNQIKLGGSVVASMKNSARGKRGNSLDVEKIRLILTYDMSERLSFFIRSDFLRAFEIGEVFFAYKISDNSTLKLGKIINNLTLSQMKGFVNASFALPNIADRLPEIRRDLIGAAFLNDYGKWGFQVGVYGEENADIHEKKIYPNVGDSKMSIVSRIYNAIYKTDTEIIQFGMSTMFGNIDKQRNLKETYGNPSDLTFYTFDALLQKNMFSLETNMGVQKVSYDSVSPMEDRHNKVKYLISEARDMEVIIVLTGEQRKSKGGALRGFDVKNKVSAGGFGAFEIGFKSADRKTRIETSSKPRKETLRAVALNWIPEDNIKVIFNVGHLERGVNQPKILTSTLYGATLKVFF